MTKIIYFLLFFVLQGFARDVIEYTDSCEINWTKGYISCSAQSAEGQNKYAAKTAAKVIARRSLLEVVKGVQITSDMTIKDGLITSDIITERVNGVIRGSRIVSNKFDSKTGSSIATVKLDMGKDLLSALLSDPTKLTWNETIQKIFNNFNFTTKLYADNLYNNHDIETLKKLLEDLRNLGDNNGSQYVESLLHDLKDNNFTGILIDVSKLERFKKALIVKLVDTSGKEIYPSSLVSKNTLTLKNTSVGYMFGFEDARNNKRIFNKPLELKVNEVYKNKLSNIVLTNKQIDLIKNLNESVLKEAKIILVLGD